jgi:hypothetical protein
MPKSSLLIGFFIVLVIAALAGVKWLRGQKLSSDQSVSSARVDKKELPPTPRRVSSQAPTQEGGDLQEMTTLDVAKLSNRIVLAKCRAVDVREVASGNIFTFSEFDVLQNVKGQSDKDSFTVRLIGGRIGDVKITSPLNIEFKPGDKYVLFLGKENKDGYPTISPQAVFHVRTNPVNKSEIVVPHPTGLLLYRAKDKQRYSDLPENLPLEDFIFSLGKLN